MNVFVDIVSMVMNDVNNVTMVTMVMADIKRLLRRSSRSP